ncbi:unnamed protein product [Larinioides sclopetarius]|uniref:Carboxylic ester hydrolase n=1 Tax=Larinioides sclopetarius TaxID=280406 RepID=A0AAV1Z573_9ARAC
MTFYNVMSGSGLDKPLLLAAIFFRCLEKNMLLHLILTIIACTVSGTFSHPEVNTPLGKIIGKWVPFNNIPVKTFQSIPYAKPPIGELRFRKPQPMEPWREPLVADQLPPGCVQYSTVPDPAGDFLPGKTQDCLYLNIWAPGAAGLQEKKAVMFWIHGGAFRIGSSRVDFYNGIVLAALGDVIVVSINFRLSLYDVLEALKWVKSNIKFFGGDEDNITIFGQSTGSITVGMLMVSPLAQGLFVRAIMESGAPTSLDAENNNKDFEISQKVAEAVGCACDGKSLENNPEEVIQCLRGKNALELAKVEKNINSNSLRGFYPRYGDDILPYNSREAFIQGEFKEVDILIGVNHNEGANTITLKFREVFGFFGHKTSQINKTFGEYIIRTNFEEFPDPDAVVRHYLGSLNENDDDRVLYEVQTASADYSRVCPSIYLAESVAKKRSRVLFYYFVHRPSNTPRAPWMGVVHFDEIYFVFGYPLRYPSNYTESEKRLSMQMIDVWSSFAKSGSTLLQFWPQYSGEHHDYFALDTNREETGSGPHLENCEFFRPYFGFE